jgi:hypothetical protein
MPEETTGIINEKNGSEKINKNDSKTPRGFVIALIIILALIVVSVIIGLILNNKKSEQPTAVVNDFVAEISKQDYVAAYNYLSDDLRSAKSEVSFQAEFPAELYTDCSLSSSGEMEIDDLKVVSGDLNCEDVSYQVEFKTKSGKLEGYSIMRKE